MAEDEKIDTGKEKNHSGYIIGIGFVGTFIWIVFVYSFLEGTSLTKFNSWNGLGDFLAGTVAPVALLWFVLGFFLQIKEVRYQRIELKKSTDELIEQTKQLTEQALLTRQDIKLKLHEATPRLAFQKKERHRKIENIYRYDIQFYNNGGMAIGVECTSPHEEILARILSVSDSGVFLNTNSIKTDQLAKLHLEYDESEYRNVSIGFKYKDAFGTEYRHLVVIPCSEEELRNFFEEPTEVIEPE